MTKLKLGPIEDDRPVKVTLKLPASLHRDLVAYAEALSRQTEQPVSDPTKLIVPMLQRFIASDRGFSRARNRRTKEVIIPAPSRSPGLPTRHGQDQ